jgi:hypothetical protein
MLLSEICGIVSVQSARSADLHCAFPANRQRAKDGHASARKKKKKTAQI